MLLSTKLIVILVKKISFETNPFPSNLNTSLFHFNFLNTLLISAIDFQCTQENLHHQIAMFHIPVIIDAFSHLKSKTLLHTLLQIQTSEPFSRLDYKLLSFSAFRNSEALIISTRFYSSLFSLYHEPHSSNSNPTRRNELVETRKHNFGKSYKTRPQTCLSKPRCMLVQ